MTIGDKIKNIRIQKNITQKELADALGIAPNSLYRYENNMREPKAEMLGRIAGALNCPVARLVGTDYVSPDMADKVAGMIKLYMGTEAPDFQNELFDILVNMPTEGWKKLTQAAENLSIEQKAFDELLSAFAKLNSEGRAEAIKRVEELTQIPKYTTPDDTDKEET